MANVKVRYLGTKKNRRIQLPYPFVSLSEASGEVTFAEHGSVMEVDAENAKRMVASDHGLFELVPEEKPDEKKAPKGKKQDDDSSKSGS